MWRYLIWSLRIRRVEYRIAELPIFLIPVFALSNGLEFLSEATFWLGLIIFLFLFALGDILNCLADRELDRIYKPHLTEAVYGIGVRGVVWQAILSTAGALLLSIFLAIKLNQWWLVPLVLAGAALAYAYSVEPIRLKRRGWLQLVFYWFGLFAGPMLFGAMLYSPLPSIEMIVVAFAFGLLQTGIILVNTAEDYPEDLALGVKTIIVAVGLKRGMHLAFAFTFLGGISLVSAWFAMAYRNGFVLTETISIGLASLAWLFALASIGLIAANLRNKSADEAIQIVKQKAVFVPFWITSQAVANLAVAICVD